MQACTAGSRRFITVSNPAAAGRRAAASLGIISPYRSEAKLVQRLKNRCRGCGTSADRSHQASISYRPVCGGTSAIGCAAFVGCPASQISNSAACAKAALAAAGCSCPRRHGLHWLEADGGIVLRWEGAPSTGAMAICPLVRPRSWAASDGSPALTAIIASCMLIFCCVHRSG